MPETFIYLFIFTVSIVLIFIYIKWLTHKAIYWFFESNHEDAEFLINYHQIPPRWNSNVIIKFGGEKIKNNYIKHRIKKLIRHFKHSSIIDDNESNNRRDSEEVLIQ